MSDAESISTLLQRAVALQQRGKYLDAIDLYAKVLAREPRQFDALHLMGVAERQRGHPQAALNWIGAALAERDDPSAHCNAGVALQDLGRPEEALQAFERALALKRDYALAWSNHGNALHRLGRSREALDSYGRALALQAANADTWANRGIALHTLGEFEEACDSFARSLELRPQQAGIWVRQGMALARLGEADAALASYERALNITPEAPDAWRAKANVLRALGRRDEALAAYQRAIDGGADATEIGFLLASLGAAPVPDAAPAAYVRQLFDQYAGHFDAHLRGQLAYRTPEALHALIAAHTQADFGHVLDLGCGTGLCGPWLRPMAERLEGLDLSPQMLQQAAQRHCYDALHCAELVGHLAAHSAAYDALVAADVLVYLGDLSAFAQAAAQALKAGGWLAFSVEAGEDAGFSLRDSGRYAHSPDYVEQVLASAGLRLVIRTSQNVREEGGQPVPGLLFLFAQSFSRSE